MDDKGHGRKSLPMLLGATSNKNNPDRISIDPYYYYQSKPLGSGKYADVFEGYSKKSHIEKEILAIKRIKNENFQLSFVDREIRILQELSAPGVKHANLVNFLDCLHIDSDVYLVMEFCNGGDLDGYLKEKGKLDETALRIFLQQMASGMKVLHEKDIVHRDLKPANILLRYKGLTRYPPVSDITFKIADFGVGRFLDSGLKAETFCGTPVFMAPEMYQLNPSYDYKTDLWSIGAIAYKCYTGTLCGAFVQIDFSAKMSASLKDLLKRLLQREPSSRANFDEFYDHDFIGKHQDETPTHNGRHEDLATIGEDIESTSATTGFKQSSIISSELVKSIEVKKGYDVYGITFLGNLIYVLCQANPNLLVVYSSQAPYYQGADIRLNITDTPQDIAACSKSQCLYITDSEYCCIWKVTVTPIQIVSWASGIGEPHTLSVSKEGQVITFGNQTLLVFGNDGQRLQSINLPLVISEPQHVVKTSAGNYIVSYGESSGTSGICELSIQGHIVRQYDDQKLGGSLLHPCHLAIEEVDDRVIVADKGNDRLVLLNADLKLEQLLPSEECKDADKVVKPFRLCLLPNGLMVKHQKNVIDIYSLTN